MKEREDIYSVEKLLDVIELAAVHHKWITFGRILDAIGPGSFGAILLLAGIITVIPIIGDIPGVPTIMGTFVFLTAAQLLLRRKKFWFPRWMLDKSVSDEKLHKALKWMRPPARFLDRWTGPRFTWLVSGRGEYVLAVAVTMIAVSMPPMELIPFSANGAGAALIVFGLSLIARDGLLAMVALGLMALTYAIILFSVLN